MPGTVGLSWEDVRRRCSADGLLPVSDVLWLLQVLRKTPQVMPSDEQIIEWTASGVSPCHLPSEWEQVLRRRKGRLAWLLRTAVELEEEVKVEGG